MKKLEMIEFLFDEFLFDKWALVSKIDRSKIDSLIHARLGFLFLAYFNEIVYQENIEIC